MPYLCPNKRCNNFNRAKPLAGPCEKCGTERMEIRPLPPSKVKCPYCDDVFTAKRYEQHVPCPENKGDK